MFKEWFEFNSFYLDIIMGVRLGKIKTNWLGVRCLTLEDDWKKFQIRINSGNWSRLFG